MPAICLLNKPLENKAEANTVPYNIWILAVKQTVLMNFITQIKDCFSMDEWLKEYIDLGSSGNAGPTDILYSCWQHVFSSFNYAFIILTIKTEHHDNKPHTFNGKQYCCFHNSSFECTGEPECIGWAMRTLSLLSWSRASMSLSVKTVLDSCTIVKMLKIIGWITDA